MVLLEASLSIGICVAILMLCILILLIVAAALGDQKEALLEKRKGLFLSLILSLIPGCGHSYIGQRKKGLLFYLYFLGFQVVFIPFIQLYPLIIIYIVAVAVDAVFMAWRLSKGYSIMRGECCSGIIEVFCPYLVEPPVFSFTSPEFAPYIWITTNYEGDERAAILRKRDITGKKNEIPRIGTFSTRIKYIEPEDETPVGAKHISVIASGEPEGLPSEIPGTEKAYFKTKCGYKPRQDGELSFQKGEDIDLLKEITEGYWAGWWLVRKIDLSVGYASPKFLVPK